tara:strand:+ start:4214 stop:4981 length:768 start_codon:yes stop_codon:yes gene_type:complete
MLVTTTNILSGVTPTVSTGASSDLPANVTNEDFSLNYTGSSSSTLVFDFGSTTSINYVAIAGILVKGNGQGGSYIQVLDNGVAVSFKGTARDHCFLINFADRTFSNLQIKLYNATNNQAPTLSYAAAGVAITIPNGGEMGGYTRQWASRNIKSKTTISNLAAPISRLKKRFAAKGTLALPNMLIPFSNQTWQDFLDFGIDNIFFINEDVAEAGDEQTKPQFTYVCYDLENTSTKAHSQTRALNNLSIKFRVYNGL